MILTVDNSFTTISKYNALEKKIVEAVLTYIDQEIEKNKRGLFLAYNKAMRFGMKRKAMFIARKIEELGDSKVCLLKEDKFPSGLLFKIITAFEKAKANPKYADKVNTYEIKDTRTRPESTQEYIWCNQPPEPRYYQEECIAIGEGKGRGTFEVCVAGGKTLIASYIIKNTGVNTLYVVPSLALLDQTVAILTEYFSKARVQAVATKDVKGKKKLKPIRVTTVQTLASLQKQDLLDKLVSDVDSIMIDEAHHGASDSYVNLLPYLNHIYYRFNFSGTYTRNDSKIMELWGVCGEKLYKYPAAQGIADGFLTPVNFQVRRLNGKSASIYRNEYTDNYGGKEFLSAVLQEVKVIPKDKSILILVDRKDAVGRQIADTLEADGINCTYMTGDNDKEDISEAIKDFNGKKSRILIASTILGEGIDIRSTDTLILARGGKSDIAITQAIGRAVRLYPGKKEATVIDFEFKNSNWLHKHTRLRIENYAEEFAGVVTWK